MHVCLAQVESRMFDGNLARTATFSTHETWRCESDDMKPYEWKKVLGKWHLQMVPWKPVDIRKCRLTRSLPVSRSSAEEEFCSTITIQSALTKSHESLKEKSVNYGWPRTTDFQLSSSGDILTKNINHDLQWMGLTIVSIFLSSYCVQSFVKVIAFYNKAWQIHRRSGWSIEEQVRSTSILTNLAAGVLHVPRAGNISHSGFVPKPLLTPVLVSLSHSVVCVCCHYLALHILNMQRNDSCVPMHRHPKHTESIFLFITPAHIKTNTHTQNDTQRCIERTRQEEVGVGGYHGGLDTLIFSHGG